MNLDMPVDLARSYASPTQKVRVVTEAWGEKNLFCLNCSSDTLLRSAPNKQAIDYECPQCDAPFQLKSRSSSLAAKILDASYQAMERAIREGRTPNLLALHYDPTLWRVVNLIVIPRFAYSLSAIEKRRPLGDNARRAGWVGCNILLTSIPPDARIAVVKDGAVADREVLREQYARLRPLEKAAHEQRGWTLDVLNVVRRLGRAEFSLADVYASAAHLARLHPANRYIEPKIRQQLQVLRDLGLVEFLGRGRYRTT